MRRCCGPSCTCSRVVIPATATGACTCCSSGRAGAVTASGYNGCGVTRAYTSPAGRVAGRRAARTPGSVTATRPDQVWALDYIFDATADGRPIKILNVTDEHTREALACVAARSINADQTVDVLDNLVAAAGTDTATHPLRQRPRTRRRHAPRLVPLRGTSPNYIEPGAPWQNPYVESFNGHLRRELLELESFNNLYEAQILLEDWRHDYNHHRPHQSLNYQTPAAFARRWHAHHQPAHS